jgi:hypothetical protein
MAITDEMTLGGLTMGGNIAMGTNKITGLGAATTDNDALAYGQSSANLAGLTIDTNPLVMSSQQITGLADGTSADHAVNKGQLDSLSAGFDRKQSCRLKTAASLSTWIAAGSGVGKTLTSPDNLVANNDFDGVTAALNDRILVTFAGASDLVADVDNGIYEVTQLATGAVPTILTRVTDADQDAEVTAGMFTFVTEGNTEADTGWYVTTDDPITVDTTAIAWSQFAGVGTFTGGDGIDITAGVVKVDLTPDIGLHFNTGKLEIELDNTPDTLDADAAGLKVVGLPSLFKINDVAVGATVDAAALDTLTGGGNADTEHSHAHSAITGVGANDHHNQVHAIDGADHSLAGATTGDVLTATSATTFAFQAPGAASEVPKIEDTMTTATDATSDGDPVYINGNNTIGKADAGVDAKSRVIGIIRTGSGAAGATPEVVSAGPATGVIAAATANAPYYLQDTGGIGTALPGAGKRVIAMGYAINATDLFVRITDYGKKAA